MRGTIEVFMSGLVHRPSDNSTEGVAANEAFTRAADSRHRTGRFTFRFFTAADKICFYKGNVITEDYVLEAKYHPIYEAHKVHAYLARALRLDWSAAYQL